MMETLAGGLKTVVVQLLPIFGETIKQVVTKHFGSFFVLLAQIIMPLVPALNHVNLGLSMNSTFQPREKVANLSFPDTVISSRGRSGENDNLANMANILKAYDSPHLTNGTKNCQLIDLDHSAFCIRSKDYPEDLIQRLIHTSSFDFTYLNPSNTFDEDISADNMAMDMELMCPSSRYSFHPDRGRTESGEWFYILKGQPSINVEICESNTRCSIIKGLRTKCEQKKIGRTLYILDQSEENFGIREMKFKIPSHCVCKVLPPANPTSDGLPDEIDCTKLGNELCTHVDNYPQKYISSLIDKLGYENRTFFDNRIENEMVQYAGHQMEAIGLCPSKSRVLYPKGYRSKGGEWKYILQDPYKRRMQAVYVDECTEENWNCRFNDYFPYGYKTACKQVYNYQAILTINRHGIVNHDYMRIPSACLCQVQNMKFHSEQLESVTKPPGTRRGI